MSNHEEEHALGDEEEEVDDEVEKETAVEEEVEETDPEKPLQEEEVGNSLSLLCKTGDGLSHAYVKLDVKEKSVQAYSALYNCHMKPFAASIFDREITNISLLTGYIHIRYLDLSKNNLRDISPLNALTQLLVLRVDHNKLTSAALDELPYLQVASFNHNRIKTTEGLNHPQLEQLSLKANQITEVTGLQPGKLTKLHTLELRGNKLTSTKGLALPNLKNLFLAANMLKGISDLERMEHLATLHLRMNEIDSLDGFSDTMKNLQYVNLRHNQVASMKEVKKIQVLPLIRAVVFDHNPIASEDDYRLEVLIALRRVERLDKEEYTDDERQEAQEIYEQRRQEDLTAQEETEELIPSDEES